MMLDLAEALDPLLNKRRERLENDLEEDEDVGDVTLQLVFFDGEEAFHDWTETDSIYGARYFVSHVIISLIDQVKFRHLAEKWATTYVQPHTKRRLMDFGTTELSTIEHLILLDLLGASRPSIRSYYLDTAWLFDAMASAESRLGDSGAFAYGKEDGMAPGKWTSFFRTRRGSESNFGYVGDDHLPFLRRGVSVLHIIAEPFPHVWHTLKV